jgi:hypothetical protein
VHSITRRPRLLVKMTNTPGKVALSLQAAAIDFEIEPLFRTIGRGRSLAATNTPQWHILSPTNFEDEVNAWDVCHQLVRSGFGISGVDVPEFAEPDLVQKWNAGAMNLQALAASGSSCDQIAPADKRLPTGNGNFWFRDDDHSGLDAARSSVGLVPEDQRVRIAHFDTGFDPNHSTKPRFLRLDLQRNFVDDRAPDDARDDSSGLFANLGHGTGTLSILAGAETMGFPLGGAPLQDVIPVRVANSVVLFSNSSVAKAFDYIAQLITTGKTLVRVITMSMGGLASQAWAEAVNALYELGVFMVTAAGNNFGNLPTHNIVYPARFRRVVAACGVMANSRPYADLPIQIMAGNYGPTGKMKTSIAAFTPNTPWARFGCPESVDQDGRGTSAATPQIAAAASLWLQKYKRECERYSAGWMTPEAVRKALFETARLASDDLRSRLGWGAVRADDALNSRPAQETDLQMQPEDSASFPFLRVITGLFLPQRGQAQEESLSQSGGRQ